MATRGRPRLPEGPTKAADRKREFDRRMRNADGQVEGEPARTPVVLYLSAEAREVIRRHREDAALAGAPPLLDSKLVEALLLAFRSQRSADPAASVATAAAVVEKSSPPPAKEGDVERLRDLRTKIRRLNSVLVETEADRDELQEEIDNEGSISARRWNTVRKALIKQHIAEGSLSLYPLTRRLNGELGELTTDASRMHAVSAEFVDYLLTLLDALDRPG